MADGIQSRIEMVGTVQAINDVLAALHRIIADEYGSGARNPYGLAVVVDLVGSLVLRREALTRCLSSQAPPPISPSVQP